MGLNFASTFKNIEDTGIAQYTGNGIFQREAIATVNLQAIISSRPGNAGA